GIVVGRGITPPRFDPAGAAGDRAKAPRIRCHSEYRPATQGVAVTRVDIRPDASPAPTAAVGEVHSIESAPVAERVTPTEPVYEAATVRVITERPVTVAKVEWIGKNPVTIVER